MQSKSTLQTFRDLPNYPVIVTRVVGLLHLVLGVLQLIPGAAILTKSDVLIALSSSLGTKLTFTVLLNGFILTFFGLASLWVAFGNFTARPSIWFTTIWVTALFVLGWISGLSGETGVLQYLLIILTFPTVVVYIFDNRIKAYFQRGKLASQYQQWNEAVRLGKPAGATPWVHTVEERKPLIATDKPL